jgi:hypothetical protein
MSYVAPVLLLLASNVFMTFAWYGHLKFKGAPIALAILASWVIAFFEYCLMVPANRYGHAVYGAAELKASRRSSRSSSSRGSRRGTSASPSRRGSSPASASSSSRRS